MEVHCSTAARAEADILLPDCVMQEGDFGGIPEKAPCNVQERGEDWSRRPVFAACRKKPPKKRKRKIW